MDAPRCRLCNTRHWGTQPCPAMQGDTLSEHVDRRRLEHARNVLRQAEAVTENAPTPVTRNQQTVTTNTPVTVTTNASVLPVTDIQTPIPVTATAPRKR